MTKQKNEKRKSESQGVLRRFLRHRMATVGFVILLLMTLSVLFLPPLLHLDPYTTGQGMPFSAPTAEHLLGTDNAGRDSFARLLYGGRVSLLVGLVSTAISILIGVPLGMISAYYGGLGLKIAPDAAGLLAEYAGTDLAKIAVETEKLRKSLPEGTVSITAEDIEKNVGISRQFSIFELTKALSNKDAAKALKIAAYIGTSPRFAMPAAVSALFMHFSRILKYEALLMRNPRPATDIKASVLGVNPYFFREYDMAVNNYPVKKCMSVIALLRDYDFKGKGGDTGEATPGQLLVELVAKILN